MLILPLGRADRELAEDLCVSIGRLLRTGVALRECALDVEGFLDRQRMQYNSTSILGALEGHFPRNDGRPRPKVLGLLAEDLFMPVLTYVFGEAQLGGDFSVVSYHRLQNERYGLPRDPPLVFRRLLKESLHELGHTYGLAHCLDPACVMHTSTNVGEIDLRGEGFCPSCLKSVRLRP